MRFESNIPQVQVLFIQDIFETDKIDGKTQEGIGTSRCGITKGLLAHQPAKRGVKKIDNWQYKIPDTMNMTAHAGKVIETTVKCQIRIVNSHLN